MVCFEASTDFLRRVHGTWYWFDRDEYRAYVFDVTANLRRGSGEYQARGQWIPGECERVEDVSVVILGIVDFTFGYQSFCELDVSRLGERSGSIFWDEILPEECRDVIEEYLIEGARR